MASYQDSSYGPRSTYAGPTNNANNAGHFPQSHSHLHQNHQNHHQNQNQNQQQHSLFYPNPNPNLNPNPIPYPHSNHHSNQSNDPSPPPPHFAPSYPNPQPSEGHAYYPQRPAYHPNLNQNGRTPLMQLPTGLPDDHFKKPYLPQQQYMNHGPPQPANFTDHLQQQRAVSDLAPAQPYPGASTPSKRLHTSSSSYPPISTTTMTMTAAPTNPPSAHSTPTSEVPSQSADPALQPGGLSSLDQQRVDALLQVNNLLLQEVTTLQKLGLKPSPQSPQPTGLQNNSSSPQATPAPPTSTGDPPAPNAAPNPNNNAATKPNATATTPTATTTPTAATAPPLQQQSLNAKKYVEFMTRLKTNIVFLVSISDQAKDKPRLPYPSHLEAPPLWLNPGTDEGDRQLDLLREEYARLRGLWPDWKPEARKLQMGGGQQQAQQQAGQQQMMQQQPQVQQQS